MILEIPDHTQRESMELYLSSQELHHVPKDWEQKIYIISSFLNLSLSQSLGEHLTGLRWDRETGASFIEAVSDFRLNVRAEKCGHVERKFDMTRLEIL